MRRHLSLFIASAILAAAQPAAPVIPSYKQLKYPPLKQVQIPEPVTFTLPNGMKVYLLENHELPVVSGSALVRTGNLFDPPDKRGLADFTGQVLRSGGTKSKTGDDIDIELENIAASVESQIGESSGSVSFSCLKENADQVMAIFKDVLTNPEFRQDKFDLAVQQEKSAISRRNDDPGDIAQREFSSIVYGRTSPYGWTIDYEHVDRIKREDLQAFYKRYFFPKNARLTLYGDFNATEMRAKLEKLFADWTVNQAPVPAFPDWTGKPQPGVFLAEKDDTTQTFFYLGHIGGKLNDKDYPALEVAANILASGFSSRLMATVRTKLGYAYNIGGGWGAGFNSPGLFQIAGSTKSNSTVDTIRVTREEIEKLRTAPVTDVELQAAKDGVLNSFVFNFDRPSKTLNRVVLYEYFGYPKDFMFQYQKAIAAVTKADVLRVAKEHWKSSDFTIVAVGNPAEFGKPLTDLKIPVTKLDLTIPEPKAATPAPAAAIPQAAEKGKALAAKAAQALGGSAALAAIRDLQMERNMELQTGGTALKVNQKTKVILPNHLRQEQTLPFGKLEVYTDLKGGWMTGPQGNMPMQAPVLQQARGELARLPVTLFLPAEGKQFEALSEDSFRITGPGGPTTVTLSSDGLPKKVEYLSTAMAGGASQTTEIYSDWRATSAGVKLPFDIVIEQGGKKFASIQVVSYQLNSGLKVEDLAQKSK
ncbi:peptidase M16 [Bryobacterales bacterium F-183]|nr:peptidase M16 [Bryobacterales bacterium F-183]